MNFVRASDKYANLLPFAFRHGVSNGTFEKNDVQSDRSTTFLSINFEPIRVLTTILSAFNSRFFQRLANFFLPVPYDKTNYLIFFLTNINFIFYSPIIFCIFPKVSMYQSKLNGLYGELFEFIRLPIMNLKIR